MSTEAQDRADRAVREAASAALLALMERGSSALGSTIGVLVQRAAVSKAEGRRAIERAGGLPAVLVRGLRDVADAYERSAAAAGEEEPT